MKLKALLFILIFVSLPAFAYDFDSARAEFAKRAQSNAHLHRAQDIFRNSLTQTLTKQERIFAIEQLSRLSFFEILSTQDANKIKSIALQCYDSTELIAPRLVGESVQYYYWRATCLSLWGEANGILASLSRSPEIAWLVQQGLAIDSTYEGGGLYRIAAALYTLLPSINPYHNGPVGNLEVAQRYIEDAFRSPAYFAEAHPDKASGEFFYSAYIFQFNIYLKTQNFAAARQVAIEAIERIDNGLVSPERTPETMIQRAELTLLLQKMQDGRSPTTMLELP